MLKDPPAAARILQQVVSSVSLPVTVKIRLGWDEDKSEELAQRLEDAGAAAMATWEDKGAILQWRGNWEPIARICERAEVPIIANGDVQTPQDAKRMLEATGCHADNGR